jgi:hypothetical protein
LIASAPFFLQLGDQTKHLLTLILDENQIICRKNYYKEGDTLYPHFDSTEAYRRALKTWARWIDKNMDPARSIVFYRGYSTAHFR